MIKTKKAPKPCDMLQRFLTKLNEYPLQDKRRSKEHNFGIIPLIFSSKVWYMDNGGLKIVLNIVADSLSSAVVEVKISGFVFIKIRSLRGAMYEFDGTEDKIEAYFVELEKIMS